MRIRADTDAGASRSGDAGRMVEPTPPMAVAAPLPDDRVARRLPLLRRARARVVSAAARRVRLHGRGRAAGAEARQAAVAVAVPFGSWSPAATPFSPRSE